MSFSRSMAATAAILVLLVVGLAACESEEIGSTGSSLEEAEASVFPPEAVVITDAKGDVRDVDGNKPSEDSQALDILHAGLHLTDAQLSLIVEHSAPVPSALQEIDFAAGVGEWLSWTLFIADQQGVIVYMPQVGLGGSEWKAYAYDKASGESVELEGGPTLEGSVLTFAFPRESMPDLAAAFKWGVGVTWQLWTSHERSDQLSFGDQATQDDKQGWSGYPYEWAAYPQK